jgi:hypothetical protein
MPDVTNKPVPLVIPDGGRDELEGLDDVALRDRIEDLQSQCEGHIEDKVNLSALIRELRDKLAATVPITNEPLLGLATTEQMFRELICRFRMEQYNDNAPDGATISVSAYAAVDRAIALAEMLGGLSAPEKEYRTVDGG